MTATNWANVFSDAGGAVGDLFAASGSRASSGSYGQAADIAAQNAELAIQATAIKKTQEERQAYQVIGGQKAQLAGAGFAESGSAVDLLRSSASQAALTQAITTQQGQITQNAYKEQSNQFKSMADAANATSTAQTIGGVLQIAGMVAAL